MMTSPLWASGAFCSAENVPVYVTIDRECLEIPAVQPDTNIMKKIHGMNPAWLSIMFLSYWKQG